MEILPVEDVGNGVDVAAQRTAGKAQGVEIAFSGVLIGGVVDGVVGDGRSNRAGDNPTERAGTGNAAELNVLEQEAGSIVEGRDGCAREPIGKTDPGERKLLEGIAGDQCEACAVLIVILNGLRVDANGLAKEQGFQAGLVETIVAGVGGEAGGDGAIENIRLSNTGNGPALD